MREAECPSCGAVVQKQIGMGMPAWDCPEGCGIFTPRMKRSEPKRADAVEAADATEWYNEALRLAGYRCAVTGERWRARSRRDPLRLEGHHVVSRERLKEAGRMDLLWDPDNALIITAAVHAAHTSAMRRIPRETLSDRNLRFAREHGFEEEIERKYPTKEEVDARARSKRA